MVIRIIIKVHLMVDLGMIEEIVVMKDRLDDMVVVMVVDVK
jgi:hypothetical protein